ncbi:similar to Saccharomyces cerevisiae YPR167C MET16 3'-phosphoadenylsulfate reductase [Maudiozyma saulgeensis]|uniref:phosphoadenylyl-sulfate reductase (thioredoxin) n=1 Tax=Maudiozyma saulgeensis TaxID=1789683 RepID=A0A1X7R2E7_9SACH|nr:similar to Saccharomyces cerevisiae YPR167C MET16 3'-phosphoadenylsulfate reductase [Kazachstania saulgeensis]
MSKVYQLNNNITVTEEQLNHWNKFLGTLSTPQEILRWAIITFPNLFQTTACGLTGLATIDMLSKIHLQDEQYPLVPLIFIDTLHNFPQTLDLLKIVETKYYKPLNQSINVFKPTGCADETDFASKYGDLLWEKDEDRYDFLAKVEPASKAYKELNVTAVFTGRRKSQGAARSDLKFVEIDELNQIIKINPLMNWTFNEVQSYINEKNVPTNELLKLGYKSIGDYHSTQPVKEGEDERSGRWKGKTKTECGIHETSRFAQFLKEKNANTAHS